MSRCLSDAHIQSVDTGVTKTLTERLKMKPVQNQWVMSQHVTRCFLMIIFIVAVVFGVSSLKPCLQCVLCRHQHCLVHSRCHGGFSGDPVFTSLSYHMFDNSDVFVHTQKRSSFLLFAAGFSSLARAPGSLSVCLRLWPSFHAACIQPPPLSELPLTEAAGSDVW